MVQSRGELWLGSKKLSHTYGLLKYHCTDSLLPTILTRRSISSAAAVEAIASSLPGFADQGLFDGQQLHFGRKAQALVAALNKRFGTKDPRFAFEDLGKLTADTGGM